MLGNRSIRVVGTGRSSWVRVRDELLLFVLLNVLVVLAFCERWVLLVVLLGMVLVKPEVIEGISVRCEGLDQSLPAAFRRAEEFDRTALVTTLLVLYKLTTGLLGAVPSLAEDIDPFKCKFGRERVSEIITLIVSASSDRKMSSRSF